MPRWLSRLPWCPLYVVGPFWSCGWHESLSLLGTVVSDTWQQWVLCDLTGEHWNVTFLLETAMCMSHFKICMC